MIRPRFTAVAAALLISNLLLGCGGQPTPHEAMAGGTRLEETQPVEPQHLESDPLIENEDTARYRSIAEEAVSQTADHAGLLARDGAHYFVSNRDGVPALYRKVRAGNVEAVPGIPSERVEALAFNRDQSHLFFLQDVGANENWSIFDLDLQTQAVTRRTIDAEMQNDSLKLARTSGQIFFSARRQNETDAKVYELPREGEPILRFEGLHNAGLEDVSPDGSNGLSIEVLTLSSYQLSRIDFQAQNRTVVYPSQGQTATVHAALFSQSGREVLVATEVEGEGAAILSLDAQTGRQGRAYVEQEFPFGIISSIRLSPNGQLLVVKIDAGTHEVLRLVDARTMRLHGGINLPFGSGELGDFNHDGSKITVGWTTAQAPTRSFAVEVSDGRAQMLPTRETESASTLGVQTQVLMIPRDQDRGSSAAALSRSFSLDAQVIPTIVSRRALETYPSQRAPVVVMIHGGPAQSSKVRWSPISEFFLRAGYAVVEPNIRGSSGFGREYEEADNGEQRWAAVEDIRSISQWLHTLPWVDADRLVVFGGSYGGYMTLMSMVFLSGQFRAGIDLVGPANIRTFLGSTSGVIHDVLSVEFGVPNQPDFLDEISPLPHANRIVSPLFVYQGENDPRVHRSESEALVRDLRARGLPCQYMLAANEGHSLDRRETKIEFLTRVGLFLQEHAGSRPQPNEPGAAIRTVEK